MRLLDNLKNKKVIATIIGVLIVALVGTVFVISNNQSQALKLKKDVVIIELGDDVSLKANDYLDTKDKKVLSQTKVSSDIKKKDNIVPVGNYNIKFIYKDETLNQKVEVKDTTSPVFKDPKAKVEVDREFDGDLATNFIAEDLSEVKITIDSKDVDLKKAGTYKAKAIATDKYKNKTEQAFEVVVGEKTKAEKEVEEKEKAKAENKETEVANNGSQGSNAGTVSNGSTGTTGGTASGSNNGTAGTTGGGTQTPVPSNPNVPNACTFIKWNNVGNSGKVFTEYNFWDDNDYELMEIWALNNQPSWSNTFTIYSIDDNCGNVGTTINWETN
ncbi:MULTISPECIES: hypothetical protein [unclassified Breznakia]|uniref:hypothetical protein n=1 Tax=unclassified Breznakia TaxID=2623764 RepID=UPI002473A042|nr:MULTISPECIES: hypothetical protein [unclassified Breznakia]MDH6367867.1 hypothetical protein [Breznakia sp. PH1-1]MDH6404955.1 hypothetical protein [Breznakia sp. PF1-11]MDH6412670.1 hypothetical protein [Breznakia sp. PFB1-11]MDH6415027.1 hypothetical protein [Breznakia sp. PFB1-14]MDH6417341.1 hypothetical protein [Breznakia sp. PFB1-4]